MFKPDDPFAPRDDSFEEAWHAQILAIADTMVQAGVFSVQDWAETLGAALREADAAGKPDDTDTYYHAALAALESLTDGHTDVKSADLVQRKSDWESAYRATPHGKPVKLSAG